MLCFTGVLVLLALLSQGANGQKDNGREMAEQVMKYLKRIILHQEQQQRVQDERMERLEQMVNETANQLQQQQIENKMIMVAMSQKLTENEERCAELVRDQVGSMMQLGNVSLEQLRDDVARQISAQQLHQQARDDVFLGKMMELADSTTQSELSLLAKCEEIQSSVSENISQILGALTGVKEGQSQIMEVVTGGSNEIQVGLTRVQDEVRTCNERQLLGRYMTIMLAEIKGTCASIASSVSTAEELLTSGFREQRRLVSANARLLGAINQTCATTTEQSLQPLNNTLSNILAQYTTCLLYTSDAADE